MDTPWGEKTWRTEFLDGSSVKKHSTAGRKDKWLAAASKRGSLYLTTLLQHETIGIGKKLVMRQIYFARFPLISWWMLHSTYNSPLFGSFGTQCLLTTSSIMSYKWAWMGFLVMEAQEYLARMEGQAKHTSYHIYDLNRQQLRTNQNNARLSTFL